MNETYKCPTCGEILKPVSCCSKSVKWFYCLKCKVKIEADKLKKD